MPSVSVLMKPASGMCNMYCEYCFYRDEMSKRTTENYGFMSEETLKNVIRKTMPKAKGCIQYAYQGGEPTLRGLDFYRKAIAYQKQYNRNGIRVTNALQTNGYGITEEWCNFFKENHFLVGVSVDGIRDVHDAYRHTVDGRPTYDRIVHAVRILDEFGVDYNILTVVNKETARHVEEIYEAYKRNGWHYQQYIACMEPLGKMHGGNNYAISPAEYGTFLIRLFRLWNADRKKGTAPYIRQFDNYAGILEGYRPEACDQRGICGIQNVVEADGSVYPCDFYMLDEYRLGNFNHDQLEDIDRKREEIGFVERSKNCGEKCAACRYVKLCRGGCKRHWVYDETSEASHNYFCDSYQMFLKVFMDEF